MPLNALNYIINGRGGLVSQVEWIYFHLLNSIIINTSYPDL